MSSSKEEIPMFAMFNSSIPAASAREIPSLSSSLLSCSSAINAFNSSASLNSIFLTTVTLQESLWIPSLEVAMMKVDPAFWSEYTFPEERTEAMASSWLLHSTSCAALAGNTVAVSMKLSPAKMVVSWMFNVKLSTFTAGLAGASAFSSFLHEPIMVGKANVATTIVLNKILLSILCY